MMIEINKVYESKRLGEEVEVLYEKLNSTGDKVYAGVTGEGRLLWFSPNDLVEFSKLLPVQEDLINSKQKHINIVACGSGCGVTTGFFYNIKNRKRDAVIVCCSYKNIMNTYDKFVKFIHDTGIPKCFNYSPANKVVYLDGYKVSFKINPSSSDDYDVYYNYNITKDRALSFPSSGNLYFRCFPSDLISGYKTTTDNGYYEVKQCDNPLLKFVIKEVGKIPKATEIKIGQFLKSETNLITGYDFTSNKHLPTDFGEAIESLNYSDRIRLTGRWVKL